jgi:hypothetical protein
MARGPSERSGPQVTQPGSRTAAANLAKGHNAIADMVTDAGDSGQPPTRGHRLPIASASLYEPAARRTMWWISLRCPHCLAVHLHRVREEDQAPGARRAGCGRMVWVIIRSVYRTPMDNGAAS